MTTMELPPDLVDSLRFITRKIAGHDEILRGLADQSGMALSSIEGGDDTSGGDGSIDVYNDDGDLISSFGPVGIEMFIDRGTCQPEEPDVTGVYDGLFIEYDGTFTDGDWTDNLIDHVEIHAMALDTDTPDDTNQIGTFTSPFGGTFNYPWHAVDGGRWITLVAVTTAGNEGTPSDPVFAVPDPIAPTDGLAPATSPAVTVKPGIRSVTAYWTAISNNDPVMYDVYARAGSDPTSTGTYFIASTPGTSIGINQLNGGTDIDSTMDIHVMVVARDPDGEGPDGTTGHATPIQIDTPDLANDAVTTAIIDAGAVTAVEIANGAVIQDKIAAHVISADKLVLGSTDNLIQDPNFRTAVGVAWNNTYGVVSILPTGSRDGGRALRVTGGGSTFDCGNLPIDTQTVEGGATYRVNASVRSDRTLVSGQFGIATAWTLSDGTIGYTGTIFFCVGGTANVYSNYTGTVQAPSNAIRLNYFYFQGTPVSGQTIDVDYVSMTRAASAELIVDGAVTAVKIAAHTITANEISSHTITAAEILASTITTNEIAANTIVAGDIQAATITTAEIAANTITAANIAAGTITATQIAATTITGAKIAAGTITATNIQAGTITANEIAANTITASKLILTLGGGNMLANSSWYDSTSLPSGFGSVTVASEVTTTYRYAKGLKLTAVGASNPFGIGITPIPSESITTKLQPNTQYTATLWFYNPSSGGVTNMHVLVAGTGIASVQTNPTVATTDRWVAVSSTFTTGASGNWSLTFNSNANPANGAVVYPGAMQLEPGDVPTSWKPKEDEILPGTIVANMIVSNTITATQIASGTITATQIASGTITSTQLTSTAIDGMVITGALIRTASSGIRVEVSSVSNAFESGTSWGTAAFYNGQAGWDPGLLWANYVPGSPNQSYLSLVAPYPTGSSASASRISLSSFSDGTRKIDMFARILNITANTVNLDSGGTSSFDFNLTSSTAVYSFRDNAGLRINIDTAIHSGGNTLRSLDGSGGNRNLWVQGADLFLNATNAGNPVSLSAGSNTGKPMLWNTSSTAALHFSASSASVRISNLAGDGFQAIQASAFQVNSDIKKKANLAEVRGALATLDKMTVYDYDLSEDNGGQHRVASWHTPGKKSRRKPPRHRGVVAQELAEFAPDLVHFDDVNGGGYVIDVYGLLSTAIAGLKELRQENLAMKEEIAQLTRRG